MLSVLVTETARHHPAADGERLKLMEQPTVGRYAEQLARIYSFERPVEAACALTNGFSRELVSGHSRAHHLAADLELLGRPARGLAPVPPRFTDAAEALGWLYVIQRNTLFHGLIARQLAIAVPSLARAAGYLTAFDGVAGDRLRALGVALDRAASRRGAPSTIIAAANDAFRAQRQWYAFELGGDHEACAA